ncbi:MAG: right-handed parallel beta-helix repeat-containing protein [Chloroflexota bacterium]
MTPEERTTERVRAWLRESATELGDPDGGLEQLLANVATTAQPRRWGIGRWATPAPRIRRADPAPRTWEERRRTDRVLATSALLMAGVVTGVGLLAAVMPRTPAPRTIVVSQDGSGDATTIAAGVALAVDGDTVLIQPGTYAEDVTVTSDITIEGNGPREAVVWQAITPADLADAPSTRAVAVDGGSTATLRGLTIVGQEMGEAITVGGGAAPTIEDIVVDMPDHSGGDPIAWHEDSGGTLRTSRLSGVIEISNRGATPIIEDNTLVGTCIVVVDGGPSASNQSHLVVRGNRITACSSGAAIQIHGGTAVVEKNDVGAGGGTAMRVGGVSQVDVRDNVVHGSDMGIVVGHARGQVLLAGNDVTDNGVGIGIFGPGDGVRLEDNVIRGNEVGLTLASSGDPVLTGNTLCGNGLETKLVPADRPAPNLDAPGTCS